MARTFLDGDLLTWEAYATSGDFGYAYTSRIVLHCLSEPARRARSVDDVGDKAAAERLVADASSDDLLALLDRSHPLD